jgi:hypothetical protein
VTKSNKRSAVKNHKTFAQGDRVEHPLFGVGTVLAIDERLTTIAFDGSRTRRFVTSMVTLEPSDVPMPESPRRTKKKVTRSG